jgi:Nucleotidyltransferase domain
VEETASKTPTSHSFLEGFAQRLVKDLGWEANPAIKAIFIVGSVASGHSDSMSDLDLVIVADPPPAYALRLNGYRHIGCGMAMIGFLQKNAPALDTNVTVIDKIWIDDLQIDISFCTEAEAAVYSYQPIIVLKPSVAIGGLQPAAQPAGYSPDDLERRLRYDFRILVVHRNRYNRWCRRGRWINVDLSTILLAVRDVILVLNGYWRYNMANPYFWTVLKDMAVSVPNLSQILEDIKELDDRIAFQQKLGLIDHLIADLECLCLSQHIRMCLYDIDDRCENRI